MQNARNVTLSQVVTKLFSFLFFFFFFFFFFCKNKVVRSISSKSIEGYLMELDTRIKGHERNFRMQEL